MTKIKYFLQNFMIDIFIQGVLISNFFELGGKTVKNLCGAIPFLLLVLFIMTILSLLAMAAADRDVFELSDEAKKKILEYPETDKGFLKIYNLVTDITCIILLLLNGLYGSFVLFAALKVCTNTMKVAIKNYKEKHQCQQNK